MQSKSAERSTNGTSVNVRPTAWPVSWQSVSDRCLCVWCSLAVWVALVLLTITRTPAYSLETVHRNSACPSVGRLMRLRLPAAAAAAARAVIGLRCYSKLDSPSPRAADRKWRRRTTWPLSDRLFDQRGRRQGREYWLPTNNNNNTHTQSRGHHLVYMYVSLPLCLSGRTPRR